VNGRAARVPLALVAAFVYAFLYAPILVLAALSFNASRLSSTWEGFTFAWYGKSIANPLILSSLRNSLLVGIAAAVMATACGTAAALALHRYRFRRAGLVTAAMLVPTVAPEIVLAASLLLLFASAGLRLGFTTVILAHVAFTVSYAFVVVKARIAGFDRSLEEAAMDLGAGPLRTFLLVTLPMIAPAVMAAALLAFALSIDDYVVTSFVAGVGSTTLPLQIYSMVKSGVSPEINAVSTLLLVATSLLLLSAHLLERGRPARRALGPGGLGLLILLFPFLAMPSRGAQRTLNLYIWSNYIAPETIARFERRHGVRVQLDLYDSNEALLAKLRQTLAHDGPKAVVGNRGYARFLRIAKGSVTLNEGAVAREARLDGKFVLTTSTDLPAAEVAKAYKSLWRVERAFRTLKSTLDVRPVFHQRDDSVIGHITGCFLALRLEVDLQRRLDAEGLAVPWPDLMRDLARLQAVIVELDGIRYRLRTDCLGHAAKAFQAAGVAIPTAVTALGPIPETEPPPADPAAALLV